MKHYILLFFLLIASFLVGQNQYADSISPNNMSNGVYYQAGPGGANNTTFNWDYPYGTKLTVNGGNIYRNFEITTTGYPFGNLKLRQWDYNTSDWTSWRSILVADSNGNVGIGSNNTSSKLLVYKGNSGGAPHVYSDLTIEDSNEGMISILTPNNKHGYFGFADNDDDYVGGMQYNHATNTMTFRVNNHNSDVVINSDGRLGVGISTPVSVLDIDGKGGSGITLRETNTFKTGDVQLFNHSGDTWGFMIRPYDTDFNGGAFNWHQDFGYKATTKNWYVETDFGIGTTETYGYRLVVNGKIHAKEVRVDLTGWSDFVFKNDYQLPTLNEVEQHIKEKGHLKDIPSEKEVKENGVLLGDMNAKLLQKIEELTLYTIGQEKKLHAQSEEIQNLKQENKLLKTLLERVTKIEEQLKTKNND